MTIVTLLKIVYLVLVLYVFYTSIRIVRADRRLVIFRLGVCIGERGPGVVYVLPFIDRAVGVDIRETVMEVRDVACDVLDNETVAMTLAIRWRILDPTKAVTEVVDVASAIRRIAAPTACSLTGTMTIGDALTQRASLARDLRAAMAEAVKGWGVGIAGVEIAEMRRAVASPAP